MRFSAKHFVIGFFLLSPLASFASGGHPPIRTETGVIAECLGTFENAVADYKVQLVTGRIFVSPNTVDTVAACEANRPCFWVNYNSETAITDTAQKFEVTSQERRAWGELAYQSRLVIDFNKGTGFFRDYNQGWSDTVDSKDGHDHKLILSNCTAK